MPMANQSILSKYYVATNIMRNTYIEKNNHVITEGV